METTKNILTDLLRNAITAENAIKGTLQKFCRSKNSLEIVASVGFTPDFLLHFKNVKPFDSSCCGRAFGMGSIIRINDIEKDIAFQPNLAIAKQVGFRAVKSVPIFDKNRQRVGVLSTHFKEPKLSWPNIRLDHIIADINKIFANSPLRPENSQVC